MPRSYSAKKLDCKEARQFADIQLIKVDIEHVIACLNALLGSHNNLLQDTVAKALFDSATIRYRRCFNHTDQVRTPIWHLIKKLPKEKAELHQYVLDIASKHIAHSINGFESSSAHVFIAEGSNGILERGGLGAQYHMTIQISGEQMIEFLRLAEILLEAVQGWQKEVSSRLNTKVNEMTDDELRQLPCGHGQREAYYDVRAKRIT